MVNDNIGYTTSHTTTTTNNNNNNRMMPPLSQRPIGIPLGSENNLNPWVIIKKNTDGPIETIVIEIPVGKDIVEGLINLAQHHQSSITVLEGSGFVTNITLINPVSHTPTYFIEGPIHMLSLSGTYFNPNCGTVPPRFTTNPIYSSFSICLSKGTRDMFGGIVGRTLKAAGAVLITATLLKKPQFYRMVNINGKVVEIEESVKPESDNNVTNVSDYGAVGSSSSQLI